MTDIRELRFSVRTRNQLLDAGIDTVEKLLAADLNQLRKEHLFGPVTLAEISRKIHEYMEHGELEEETENIISCIYNCLSAIPDHKVEKVSQGLSVVTPSGREMLIKVG